ncbi:ABC transporter ATP-binding protein [Treponema brennaborense]|uniref:Sulfate-transporting ATPase n=1 Tax=Treponema brennaborense (strain DSM 12168 / CIP 105900 / DD5/3) TaxID=906968 RepID=F4LM39_TREBD|nr:ABC transporter ATP-binding protein [Treponema brennaborense]AEE16718.1 Sulfate-transporting ATPase [Treponema brennaborense DSM 12168]
MIKLDSFTKKYGSSTGAQDVTFTVEPGSVTGLLGPNGAGKTTVLKAICAIHYPTSGHVGVNGFDAAADPVRVKECVGYVSEQPALVAAFTVGEFLTYAANVRLAPAAGRNAVKRAVDRVCADCAIEDVFFRKISALSKGYRQRLSFAQALLHDPPVLILDEPVSGLDPAQIRQMRNLIRSLAKNRTVLLSTHLMQEVEALCAVIHIMNAGRVAASGTAEQICAQTGAASLEDAFLSLTAGTRPVSEGAADE